MVEFENMEQREVLETPNLEESPNETLDRKLREIGRASCRERV